MCEYCKNKTKNRWLVQAGDYIAGVSARVVKIDGVPYLSVSGWYDGWHDGAVGIEQQLEPIRFCPMCGRDLRGDA